MSSQVEWIPTVSSSVSFGGKKGVRYDIDDRVRWPWAGKVTAGQPARITRRKSRLLKNLEPFHSPLCCPVPISEVTSSVACLSHTRQVLHLSPPSCALRRSTASGITTASGTATERHLGHVQRPLALFPHLATPCLRVPSPLHRHERLIQQTHIGFDICCRLPASPSPPHTPYRSHTSPRAAHS